MGLGLRSTAGTVAPTGVVSWSRSTKSNSGTRKANLSGQRRRGHTAAGMGCSAGRLRLTGDSGKAAYGGSRCGWRQVWGTADGPPGHTGGAAPWRAAVPGASAALGCRRRCTLWSSVKASRIQTRRKLSELNWVGCPSRVTKYGVRCGIIQHSLTFSENLSVLEAHFDRILLFMGFCLLVLY